jgi:hypothetical protein
MIETKSSTVESLQAQNLHELSQRSSGPCITILLPPFRPAEHSKSKGAVLKILLQDALRQLTANRVSEPVVRDLVTPLEQLAGDPELAGGSSSCRAIFRSPEALHQFELVEPVTAALMIGGCFQIRPILRELVAPHYYVLELTKKRVELVRATGVRGEPVELPQGIPVTLEAALSFKPPDHDLENRAAAGSGSGAMHGIRFGTGSARENEHTYLADFYKAVDRGIHELLHAARPPLVLAGVQEDTALYRSIAAYPNLLEESVPGSHAGLEPENGLLRQAFTIVRLDSIDQAAASLTESKERNAPARFSTDLDKILHAAIEGRIHRLYIDENAQRIGRFKGQKRGGRCDWGEEDLLNLAAVETFRQGGAVFALPGSKMPDHAVVAAVFRY